MGRLIDVDMLIEYLEIVTDTKGVSFKEGFARVLNDILEIEPAYDVDTVVKQIENASTEVFGHSKVIDSDCAIKIIKNGGIERKHIAAFKSKELAEAAVEKFRADGYNAYIEDKSAKKVKHCNHCKYSMDNSWEKITCVGGPHYRSIRASRVRAMFCKYYEESWYK